MTITAIKEARIGKPKTRLGTTIYPIFLPDNSPADIKIATDQLIVSELESASVPQIQVHNPTANPLLIPAGMVLSGGRQTRTVNVSILVAAGSTIVIPVSCVEAGRGHGLGACCAASVSHTPPRVESDRLALRQCDSLRADRRCAVRRILQRGDG